jgi:RND family efflux transporter MFP subunit
MALPGLKRRLLIIPPVLAGVALLVFFVRGGSEPEKEPPAEKARPVSVIAVPLVEFVPRAIGYGNVQPGRSWEAVAEVSGRIVAKHVLLESGEIVSGGLEVLRIDPGDYQLAVESAKSKIRGAEAQIAELDVRELNAGQSLKIEQRGLTLAEKELARKQSLLKRGTIAQATVDEVERTVLSLRQAVQGHKSSLALIPAEREVLQANLSLYQAELQQAERNLDRTRIATPFDGRVAEVSVEERQFAAAGQVLAVIDGVDTAEVAAQIPLQRMRYLFAASEGAGASIELKELGSVFEQLGLTAIVRLRAGDLEVAWDARFARIRETIDPATRTVGVVVAVDNPYGLARAGRRPPLAKNMYVEVELRGEPVEESIVVPRSVLHEGMVYLLGAENRLRRQPVTVGINQGSLATITKGLKAGDRIILTDLVPAVDGMLLNPIDAPDALRALTDEATGRGVMR